MSTIETPVMDRTRHIPEESPFLEPDVMMLAALGRAVDRYWFAPATLPELPAGAH